MGNVGVVPWDHRVFKEAATAPLCRKVDPSKRPGFPIFSVLNPVVYSNFLTYGLQSLRGFHLWTLSWDTARPYTSSHRSSNARIINPETCPKNFAEIAACKGFAKAKAISYLTRVDSFPPEAFAAGSNFQVVSSDLNRGV